MTPRLAEDIALLERAAAIADQAITPAIAQLTVPVATFEALTTELEASRGRPTEYRLIRDEAVWLIQAARNVTLYRADDNEELLERWLELAAMLREGVAEDLAKARNSIGAIQ